MNISHHLRKAVKQNASDIYFIPGSPVRLKIEGEVVELDEETLSAKNVKDIAQAIMSDEQREAFANDLELDFSLNSPENNARFRVNAYHQREQVSLVMRYVKSSVPELSQLGVPPILRELIMHKRGLILMAGATNSGKSTTLAAMLNERNAQKAGHIVTVEDPIEFIHPHRKSIVSQRELGIDTRSYHRALRSCMREAPDVILIGEVRDSETMDALLELCNTGHLAISTLHANNAYQALQRIVNMFPIDHHKKLFMDLSMNLRGIISQRLVMNVKDKRSAAVEVMINTPYIADLILNGRIDEIVEAMENSGAKGMSTFDESLLELYRRGIVRLEEALSNADSRTNLEARMNFG